MKKVNFNGQPFHFIGIGGIGMSALAYILAKRNLPVSGSDLRPTHITQRLQGAGAQIFHRQEANNLALFHSPGPQNSSQTVPQVICSTAINDHNKEYQAARDLGYPIFHRSDVLAALIADYDSIAVAGTHGKTTTSSLIGYVLLEAGLDPTIIVGGEVDAWEGNARLGQGRFLVAEADESDGSLTKHAPKIGVITNIELDHPDHYQNLSEVIDTFHEFAHQCQILVACLDCDTIAEHFRPTISYSLDPEKGADYTVSEIIYEQGMMKASVWEKGSYLGQMEVKIPGQHNISNALAVVAIGRSVRSSRLACTITKALGGGVRASPPFFYRGSAWRLRVTPSCNRRWRVGSIALTFRRSFRTSFRLPRRNLTASCAGRT